MMSFNYSPKYPSQEEITRDRIMDACALGLEQYDLQGLRIKHIIELSGLSKQTVYNHFKNRDEVLLGVFAREGARLSEACANEIRSCEAIDDKFVWGLIFIYEQLPRNPVLAQIISNHHEFLLVLGLQTIPMGRFGRLCFGEVVEEYPALAGEFEEIAEFWGRSVRSLLLFGTELERRRDALEDYVRRRLLPGLHLVACLKG